jgi:hypothetical protein
VTSPPRVEDRGTRLALGFAMAISAALILWESRGTTFFNDELVLFQRFQGDFDPEVLLMPFNGHLIAVGSLIFEAGLELAGPEPLLFRLVGIATLLLLAGTLYAYLRRLVSPWLALAPVVVILFLGSSWEVLLWPMSNINTCLSMAAGVGALVALESDRRRSDLIACALLLLGLATGTYALAFLVGAAVSVLAGRDRWARAWIVVVPATLFAAWWLWARQFDQDTSLALANVWLLPSFSLQSLAVVLAAMTGLSATLSGEGLNPTIEIDAGWGRVLAVAALAGMAVRLARGRLPRGFWVALTALLTFWALIALSFGPDRIPEESRYILPGAVLVTLVAGQALAGIRIPTPAAVAVLAVTLLAIATGIRQLHDGGLFLRDYSDRARATLAGIEAAPDADPGYEPRADPELADIVPSQLPVQLGPYLDAVERFGSPAFTRGELQSEPAEIREIADRVRVAAIAASAGVEPPEP